jgi:hypothetical protein
MRRFWRNLRRQFRPVIEYLHFLQRPVVSFETADGNGKLTRVVINLKDGKPVSMSWQ